MPGDPHQCRLNAQRCLLLAKRARRPKLRKSLNASALTWTKLAAELESDEVLLSTIAELEFSEAYDALLRALRLRP
jgi:hypothetical protein